MPAKIVDCYSGSDDCSYLVLADGREIEISDPDQDQRLTCDWCGRGPAPADDDGDRDWWLSTGDGVCVCSVCAAKAGA